MLRNLAQLLSTNALTSVAGLLCLPLLYRSLGASGYGHLSLFLLALGLLSNLDLSRPILVREYSAGAEAGDRSKLPSLVRVSQLLLAPLALLVGTLTVGLPMGLALAVGILLFVATSEPYAELCARGQVGTAASIRNLVWVAAFLTATVLSLSIPSPAALIWPFVGANLLIFLLVRKRAGTRLAPRRWLPDAAVLRTHGRQALDILGLSLAVGVVTSVDRLLLHASCDEEVFGRYSAQYDLALKVHILSTALGTVLFPALSRLFTERGHLEAARIFVQRASWIVLGYFLFLGALIVFSADVLRILFGTDLTQARPVYPLLLVGVFLGLFGHLITPWQRACGDYRTQRRAYALAALVMVAVGLVLIPRYHMLGAAIAFLSARSADALLVISEVRRLPREVLGTPRIVALCTLTAGLVALGLYHAFGPEVVG